jgi:hypothetical protein
MANRRTTRRSARAKRRPFHVPIGAAVPAPIPSQPLDPYDAALQTCIRRVRDSGDEAVCRFDPPFDEMDFGQRHCNAKCASMTVEVRPRYPPQR